MLVVAYGRGAERVLIGNPGVLSFFFSFVGEGGGVGGAGVFQGPSDAVVQLGSRCG